MLFFDGAIHFLGARGSGASSACRRVGKRGNYEPDRRTRPSVAIEQARVAAIVTAANDSPCLPLGAHRNAISASLRSFMSLPRGGHLRQGSLE